MTPLAQHRDNQNLEGCSTRFSSDKAGSLRSHSYETVYSVSRRETDPLAPPCILRSGSGGHWMEVAHTIGNMRHRQREQKCAGVLKLTRMVPTHPQSGGTFPIFCVSDAITLGERNLGIISSGRRRTLSPRRGAFPVSPVSNAFLPNEPNFVMT
jgi:hypothetical protein